MSRNYYTIQRDYSRDMPDENKVVYLVTNGTLGHSLSDLLCHHVLSDHPQASYPARGVKPSDLSTLNHLGGRRFIRANGAIRWRKLNEFGFTQMDAQVEYTRNQTKLDYARGVGDLVAIDRLESCQSHLRTAVTKMGQIEDSNR